MLQELEAPYAADVTVNDAFRPLSRFFDRVSRPEQLPSALISAMRVLTDPVETGAVTIALPQDVQAEAHDWPVELFAPRTWRVARPLPEAVDIADAAAVIRSAKRPLIVAGGGVHYSGAEEALRALCEQTGIPVGESQAGKGSLPHGHPQEMGADRVDRHDGRQRARRRGRRRHRRRHALERLHDGLANRLPGQGSPLRQHQHRPLRRGQALGAVGRLRRPRGADRPRVRPRGVCRHDDYRSRQAALWSEWDSAVEAAYHPAAEVTDQLAEGLLTQGQVLGAVNELHRPARRRAVCGGLDAR